MAIDLHGTVALITGGANRRYGGQDSLDAYRLCRADEVNLARQGWAAPGVARLRLTSIDLPDL